MASDDEAHENENDKEQADTEKPSRWRVVSYVVVNIVGIVLIIAGISLVFWVGRPYMTLYLSSSTKTAMQVKVDEGRMTENRIIIPEVLVDAPIIEGFTEEALEKGIGHVIDSAVPGEVGNVILAGHNYAYFVQGDQNLFSLLHLIRKDVPIYVFWEGKRYTYKMISKTTVPKDDPDLLKQTDVETLTLIASASSWDAATISSTRRLIIKAKPVKD